jgi:hypothetical protein
MIAQRVQSLEPTTRVREEHNLNIIPDEDEKPRG